MEHERVLVLDFGGQYNQLIARRVRDLKVYCDLKPCDMTVEEIRKYSIRPVLLREQICFQVESHTKTQVFHENLDKEETLARLADILPLYKQVQIRTESEEATALINKKGKASIRSDRKKTEGRTAKE